MQIMLRKGITLRQGTFAAVIAPERTVISALNTTPELERFLFLFVCGNYSRLISHIGRESKNFEVRRPFTADQFLAVINESAHTVVFIEHDATLFDNAGRLLEPAGLALRQAGREALVVLYAPSMDRSFAALARHADRLIEILSPGDEPGEPRPFLYRSQRGGGTSLPGQTTLGVT
jgi:DNA polymerase I